MKYGGYDTRYILTVLTIDTFQSLVPPLVEDKQVTAKRVTELVALMNSEGKFSSVPQLNIKYKDEDGSLRVCAHEGRHRALALRKQGQQMIPVWLYGDNLRWLHQEAPCGVGGRFREYKEHWPLVLQGQSSGRVALDQVLGDTFPAFRRG